MPDTLHISHTTHTGASACAVAPCGEACAGDAIDVGTVLRLDGMGIAVDTESLGVVPDSPFCCWICFCDSEGGQTSRRVYCQPMFSYLFNSLRTSASTYPMQHARKRQAAKA